MKFQKVFGVVLTMAVLMFFLFVCLKLQTATQAIHDIMLIIVGGLMANFNTVVSFFFGSSKSSADKTDTINTVIANQAEQPKA